MMTIDAGHPQLGGDIKRNVGDYTAIDQRVSGELDRREHARKRRAGDDREDDVAGFEDERPPGREVSCDDRQRDRSMFDQAGAEMSAKKGDAVTVVEERRPLARQRQRHSPGMHAQQVSPPDVGPDPFDPAYTFGVAGPGEQRRVHRTRRDADQPIGSQAGRGQRVEHTDLIRGQRAATRKHEGEWSRQRPQRVDLHAALCLALRATFLIVATFPNHPPSATRTS